MIARILIDASREGKSPVDMDWLAKQCGIWFKDLEILIVLWVEKKWIDFDRNMNIHVLNVEAIEDRIAFV